MKLKIVSDVHLEVNGNWFDLDHEGDADVLILAGDICLFKQDLVWISWLKEWADFYDQIIWVPGNHEYWGGSLNNAVNKAEHFLSHNNIDNIIILERGFLEYEDIAFIGATMWTDYDGSNPMVMRDARRFIVDFSKIRHGPIGGDPYQKPITPELILNIHKNDVGYIEQELERFKDKKRVVITHHAPSWQSVSPGFIGDYLNGAYVSNLEELILNHQPDMWIHGHTHSSFDYKIGETRILCNPVGYGNENITGFIPNVIVEV